MSRGGCCLWLANTDRSQGRGGGGGGEGVSVSCGSLLVGRFPSPEAVLPLVLWVPAPGQDRYE